LAGYNKRQTYKNASAKDKGDWITYFKLCFTTQRRQYFQWAVRLSAMELQLNPQMGCCTVLFDYPWSSPVTRLLFKSAMVNGLLFRDYQFKFYNFYKFYDH
jgi:hypothetical protein